jgi:hypothetical protein
MLVSSKYLVLSSAVLLAALPAFSTEETPNVAVPMSVHTAVVKCPGVSSIPFTVDEEQSLPLRVVGSLVCGDTVALLSDAEGYTAQIRTKDGQEGYVARIYLADSSGAPATVQHAQPSLATPVNGVVRWYAGAPGCDEFLSHGRHVESVTANGITVQVSVQDSGWKYRTNIAISNQSGQKVEVLPGIITLDELSPNLRALLVSSPEKLAHTPTHQIFWTLVDAVPSRSAVANYSSNAPAADRASSVADYLNPHLALASTRHAAFERSESIDAQSVSLRPVSIPSGQINAGVMWFDRDSSARELSLRVPVGDMVFDFAFSFEQKK